MKIFAPSKLLAQHAEQPSSSQTSVGQGTTSLLGLSPYTYRIKRFESGSLVAVDKTQPKKVTPSNCCAVHSVRSVRERTFVGKHDV